MKDKSKYLLKSQLYKPLNELGWGVECLNKTYQRNVVITTENNLNKLAELVNKGWQTIPGSKNWLLRSPEVSLYDLSEIHRNPSSDPIQIFSFYQFMKKNNLDKIIRNTLRINNINDLKFLILKSKSYFESCCRIAGSDTRIKLLPKLIYNELRKNKNWNAQIKKVRNIIQPRKFALSSKSFDKCSNKTKNFLLNILNKYETLGRVVSVPPARIYTGFWKNIPSYDAYFFIPTGGFPFICGFVEETKNYDKISLWEYHSTIHNNKEVVWLNPNVTGKRHLAIIDIVYSGKTINHINKKVGHDLSSLNNIQVDNIGLFPKSRLSFPKLQYAVILDRVINVSEINYKRKNFFEDTFIYIVNNQPLK